MSEKLKIYIGIAGKLHEIKDNLKERFDEYKTSTDGDICNLNCYKTYDSSEESRQNVAEEYTHIYRKKTRKELIRISAAVMGLEFSYAAETAFVSPTLLKIGVQYKLMTMVWGLSPLIGFFITPILGSLSDRCPLKWGRRRPFILAMAIGIFLGLILVPNGENLGYSMGDERPANVTNIEKFYTALSSSKEITHTEVVGYHPWGLVFTIIGTVLLDFNADACQSPTRAYLLDNTIPEDHARGLSIFTVMSGLGGFLGYAMGGINWDVTRIGILLGGHVHTVFTFITIIFVICVTFTLTSIKEVPLGLIESSRAFKQGNEMSNIQKDEKEIVASYGTSIDKTSFRSTDLESPSFQTLPSQEMFSEASFFTYLKSIFCIPNSIRIICVTNLFCWMSHISYSLYFTDFVGEAVFNGVPTAPEDSVPRQLYEEGVRFGCWGMSMYSLSCACYSLIIEKLITRYGTKHTYINGLLFYSLGMLLMATIKHKFSVIIFSWTAGVMYATLFTIPYILIANYHSKGMFEVNRKDTTVSSEPPRGLGTDVAIVSSMLFLAQFILSLCMGSIINFTGTTTAVVYMASFLAFCGAISATQVMYLDV